jgi:uncharacterized protein
VANSFYTVREMGVVYYEYRHIPSPVGANPIMTLPPALGNDTSERGEPAPRRIRQFILKIHGRCNLACDYCYVYTMADQRWRTRPALMSKATVDLAASRIGEHLLAHRAPSAELVFHGGEPLLAGMDRIAHATSAIKAQAGDIRINFMMQTNGTRLDDDTLHRLRDLDIGVGVSLDGDEEGNDRHRLGRRGRGSYPAVSAALHRLNTPEYRDLFRGLLCTIDLRNDPVRTYEALLDFRPPTVDFLLPHRNWSSPPLPQSASATPWADWLIAVFDRWYSAPIRETGVRMFEAIMNVLAGQRSTVEGIGIGTADMVVIETDGTLEYTDMLASTFEGAAATGLHLAQHPLDAFPAWPWANLPSDCRQCDLAQFCGGGLPAHRYLAHEGFDRPSVYCPDLYALISHIQRRLVRDLTAMSKS